MNKALIVGFAAGIWFMIIVAAIAFAQPGPKLTEWCEHVIQAALEGSDG